MYILHYKYETSHVLDDNTNPNYNDRYYSILSSVANHNFRVCS